MSRSRSDPSRTAYLRGLASLPEEVRADLRQRRKHLQLQVQRTYWQFGSNLAKCLVPIGVGVAIAIVMIQKDAFFTSSRWKWITVGAAIAAVLAPVVVCALHLPRIRRQRQEIAIFEDSVQELIHEAEGVGESGSRRPPEDA